MSDEAVSAKTGKRWDEWFRVLDLWGGVAKGHQAMARHLAEEFGLTGWWSQTVTVEFERARGLRDIHETKSGYEVSVSRVIDSTVEAAWTAWTTSEGWNAWFSSQANVDARVGGRYENADKDAGTFLAVVRHERMKFTWEQPQHSQGSVVEVRFYNKGSRNCQVVLQHSRLANRKERDDLKEGWSWAMDSLRSYLETGQGIPFKRWKQSRAESKK